MARLQPSRNRNCSLVNITNSFTRLTSGIAVLSVWLAFALLLEAAKPMQAQTVGRDIYSFTGGTDGGIVLAGVVADTAGNLYGTTAGSFRGCLSVGQCGTVFELSPNGDQWVFKTLYRFRGGNDGAYPAARLALGPDGSLYGTTVSGGINQICQQEGCGTVFRLTPNSDGSWSESIIYRFLIVEDLNAGYGNGVVVDHGGNVYGTDVHGGTFDAGSVYQLTPSDTGYGYSVIYSFGTDQDDGNDPWSSPTLDSAGNLYGTVLNGPGPCGCSLVWKLTRSGDGWIYNIIYQPKTYDGGGYAYAGVTLDSAGNVYGAYSNGGPSLSFDDWPSGTVFRLTPSGDGYNYSLLHYWDVEGGGGPTDLLAIDAAGNVYGTDLEDDDHNGDDVSVFKLTPQGKGKWGFTDLYSPYPSLTSGLILAPNGRLYGTTEVGGAYGWGSVFEAVP